MSDTPIVEPGAPYFRILVQRWPVMQRVVEDGKMVRSERGYQRTKAPLEERELEVIGFVSRTRVRVHFGSFSFSVFSVNTGRCILIPDWIISKESLKALRKIRRELFPTAPKPRKKRAAIPVAVPEAVPATNVVDLDKYRKASG